jgi:hypothetical protein
MSKIPSWSYRSKAKPFSCENVTNHVVVVKWFQDLVADSDLLETIAKESEVPEGKKSRPKSKTLMKLIDVQFKPKNCRSDISCLRYVTEVYIETQQAKKTDPELYMLPVMIAWNTLLPKVYPEQGMRSSYEGAVSFIVSAIKKLISVEFQGKHRYVLQFGGGSEDPLVRKAFRDVSKDAAAKTLAYNLAHAIPVAEIKILKTLWACYNTPRASPNWQVHTHIFIQLMIYCRKSEVLNPRVSRFCIFEIPGYIHQLGSAKEKVSNDTEDSVEPELEVDEEEDEKAAMVEVDDCGDAITPEWLERRQIYKPILPATKIIGDWDNTGEQFTVQDVLDKIRDLRASLDLAGKSDKTRATLLGSRLERRIRHFFPEANLYAKKYRISKKDKDGSGLNSHFLRKVGLNYAYYLLKSGISERFSAFAAKFGGWDLASGLSTSNSYNDVVIVPLPNTLEKLDEFKLAQQEVIASTLKECEDALLQLAAKKEELAQLDLEGATLGAQIVHQRGLKRSFIDITGDNEVQVRIPFHSRRRDGSAVERARESMRLLIAAGTVPTQMLLRDLGFGGESAKAAFLAGPSAAPGE